MAATTIKDALAKWSDENDKADPTKSTSIELQFMLPPIEKMDNTLSTLVKCEFLSLSTNNIEQITGLQGMKCLKIISLARNSIKNLNGLQPVAKTLEQLWISYNDIEKTKGIEVFQNLTLLSMQFNMVKDWAEFNRLSQLTKLTDLYFMGNIINEEMEELDWLKTGKKKIPQLETLEGHFVMGSQIHIDQPEDDEKAEPAE
ncbi:dynein axonemal light chain 1 [Halyomorpha halys]|uniref:dynein axonemal light chain 1 n=1 Tax=Halyomorpha halys TaxID=286706 RepID=UPI0006D4FA88|nr:dynein light chain 1, axonemal [Halyomorpha halys]